MSTFTSSDYVHFCVPLYFPSQPIPCSRGPKPPPSSAYSCDLLCFLLYMCFACDDYFTSSLLVSIELN